MHICQSVLSFVLWLCRPRGPALRWGGGAGFPAPAAWPPVRLPPSIVAASSALGGLGSPPSCRWCPPTRHAAALNGSGRTLRQCRRVPPPRCCRPCLVVGVLVGWLSRPRGARVSGAASRGLVRPGCLAAWRPLCFLAWAFSGLPMPPARCSRPRVGRRCGGGGPRCGSGFRVVKHAPFPGRLAAGRGLTDPRRRIKSPFSVALVPEIGPPGEKLRSAAPVRVSPGAFLVAYPRKLKKAAPASLPLPRRGQKKPL